MWVRSGPDRLCQTRLIPRSPDGDNKDFGGYSFCVAMFDTTGRFCDYHFQSYFQVPIETREDWLDTADIVQVTFFTNSQEHLSLCLGDSSYRAIAFETNSKL